MLVADVFFFFQFDIGFDLIFGENTTFGQELHVLAACIHGFAQRTANGGDLFELLRRQVGDREWYICEKDVS